MNWIFAFLIVSSVLVGAFDGAMPKLTESSLGSAKTAVELAIGLVGQMALWLGFMAILREAGLLRTIARALAPVMKRLFPSVPADHPAMGAMILNIAANMLGLANAATPFGLKAIAELNKLNTRPGVATNAMALFLAINTSGVAVLPLGVVAVRATLGSSDPAGIVVPSILASALNTVFAVALAKWLERLGVFAPERYAVETALAPEKVPGTSAEALAEAEQVAAPREPARGIRRWGVLAVAGLLIWALVRHVLKADGAQGQWAIWRGIFSDWLLPFLMISIVVFGVGRRVPVYEVFVAAAKEGFQIAVSVIPFLVAILVGIGMFRASGALDALTRTIGPITSALGFPAEALPMALIRPLSGSGALAVMTDTMRAYGPDTFVGYLVSVLNGTSETTFYVLAVYFGSVGVKSIRHTLIACLSADFVGVVAATWICHLFF